MDTVHKNNKLRHGKIPCLIFPSVAQLDNAADSDSEERGFKSLRADQKPTGCFSALPGLYLLTKGFESESVVNDSPGDCQSR